MVTLNAITLTNSEDKPKTQIEIIRNKIAGTSRTRNTNLGTKNTVWNITGFVKTEADEKALAALASLSTMVFVDKYGDSHNVHMVMFDPVRKNHSKVNYTMILEEVE